MGCKISPEIKAYDAFTVGIGFFYILFAKDFLHFKAFIFEMFFYCIRRYAEKSEDKSVSFELVHERAKLFFFSCRCENVVNGNNSAASVGEIFDSETKVFQGVLLCDKSSAESPCFCGVDISVVLIISASSFFAEYSRKEIICFVGNKKKIQTVSWNLRKSYIILSFPLIFESYT